MGGWLVVFVRTNRRAIQGVVTLSLLVLAAHVLDSDAVKRTVARVDPWSFFVIILIAIFDHIILGWRWYLIVRGNAELPFRSHLRRYLIGMFLNTFAPGAVGGDIYRFFALRSKTSDRWLLAGAILRERMIGLSGLAVFFLFCYLAYRGAGNAGAGGLSTEIHVSAALLFIGLVCLIPSRRLVKSILRTQFIAKSERLTNLARLLAHSLDLGSFRWALGMLSISLVVCSLWGVSIYLVADGLNIFELRGWHAFYAFAMVGVLSDIIRAIPISFQGIGVREWAFAYLLTGFGASFDVAFVVGTAAYVAVSLSILFAGAVGFLLPDKAIH